MNGVGNGNVQTGKGSDTAGGAGHETLTPDQMKKLYESKAATVSPEYRKEVEDYFKNISESAGGGSGGSTGGTGGTGGARPRPARPQSRHKNNVEQQKKHLSTDYADLRRLKTRSLRPS